jgi:ChaB
MPGREELPSTVQRSPAEAQETWIKAHDSAAAIGKENGRRTAAARDGRRTGGG